VPARLGVPPRVGVPARPGVEARNGPLAVGASPVVGVDGLVSLSSTGLADRSGDAALPPPAAPRPEAAEDCRPAVRWDGFPGRRRRCSGRTVLVPCGEAPLSLTGACDRRDGSFEADPSEAAATTTSHPMLPHILARAASADSALRTAEPADDDEEDEDGCFMNAGRAHAGIRCEDLIGAILADNGVRGLSPTTVAELDFSCLLNFP